MRSKTRDLFVVLLWNIPAFFLARAWGVNDILSLFILLCVPALYVTYRKPDIFRKAVLFGVVCALPGASIISYFAHTDADWFNPSYFPRIFGVYPAEDFVWGILYVFAIVALYEYFFERERVQRFPRYFKKSAFTVIAACILFSLGVFVWQSPIVIPYFYTFFIFVFFIAFPWIIIFFHRVLIPKMVAIELLLLVPTLIAEWIGNVNHNWSFPGHHFIGAVTAAGVSIPLEEFLWLLLAAPAFCAYYELLADDGK